MAMIAITTSSSMSVKPRRPGEGEDDISTSDKRSDMGE